MPTDTDSGLVEPDIVLHVNPGGEVACARLDDVPGFAIQGRRYPRGVLLSKADVEAIDEAIVAAEP
jgi:hypothetical protein